MKNQSMHPGQILKTKFIDPDQITIKDLAEQLDISTPKLSKIIKGNQSITYTQISWHSLKIKIVKLL